MRQIFGAVAEYEKTMVVINQNFRFGTLTRTWYSLSSPECTDLTP